MKVGATATAAAAGGNVTIIDRVFTPEETLALMDGCEAYVSLHRGSETPGEAHQV